MKPVPVPRPNEDLAQALGEGWLVPLDRRPQGPTELALSTPIVHGSERLHSITIRQLRGVHVRQAPEAFDTHDATLRMLGLLSGLPDSVLDQLAGEDLTAAINATLEHLWPLFELPANGAGLPGELRRPWPELRAPLELDLEQRVKVGSDATSRLTFSPLTGKIVRRLPNRVTLPALPALVEALTGCSRQVFDELTGPDLQRALAVAQCFFGATQPRGSGSGRSSPTGMAGAPRS